MNEKAFISIILLLFILLISTIIISRNYFDSIDRILISRELEAVESEIEVDSFMNKLIYDPYYWEKYIYGKILSNWDKDYYEEDFLIEDYKIKLKTYYRNSEKYLEIGISKDRRKSSYIIAYLLDDLIMNTSGFIDKDNYGLEFEYLKDNIVDDMDRIKNISPLILEDSKFLENINTDSDLFIVSKGEDNSLAIKNEEILKGIIYVEGDLYILDDIFIEGILIVKGDIYIFEDSSLNVLGLTISKDENKNLKNINSFPDINLVYKYIKHLPIFIKGNYKIRKH